MDSIAPEVKDRQGIRRSLQVVPVMVFIAALGDALMAQGNRPDGTWLVSVDSSGNEGDRDSYRSSISGDGRYVAFESEATNLVAGDTNGVDDVFVHDRLTGITTRVSVSSTGTQADRDCGFPWISADGRFVSFATDSPVLVPEDTNGAFDVFVHDRVTGRTVRASVNNRGRQGNFDSGGGTLSADGRYVAFNSYATNLVRKDTNGWLDVFVHDLQTGRTRRVSVDSNGIEGNWDSTMGVISADGSTVAFESRASNLVPGDTNGWIDIFVHDIASGATRRASVSSQGDQADQDCWYPSISGDGRYIAFETTATTLVHGDQNGLQDVYLHDALLSSTIRASVAVDGGDPNGRSGWSSLSATGTLVGFDSGASNLISNDQNGQGDVFVFDATTGNTTRVSVRADGSEATGQSGVVSISQGGRHAAFNSNATDMAPGSSGRWHIYVHGAYLTLEAAPATVAPGASLTLTTWKAHANTPSLLVVTAVNGSPTFAPMLAGSFNGQGTWSVAGTVPPSLSGNQFTIAAVGITPPGWVDITNEEVITIQ